MGRRTPLQYCRKHRGVRGRKPSATLGNREFYSITCSALANTLTGIVMPREFAVFRLMTSSNLVDCSTD